MSSLEEMGKINYETAGSDEGLDREDLSNWPQIVWYFKQARGLSEEDWTELAVKGESAAAESTGLELQGAKDEVAEKLGSVEAMDRIGVAAVREIATVLYDLEERIAAAAAAAASPMGAKYRRLIPEFDLDEVRLTELIAESLRTLFKAGAIAVALKPYLAAKSFKALWLPWERRLPARSIPK